MDPEKLQKLNALYRERLARESGELLALAALEAPGPAEVARLRALAHGIAGSAAMFGHAEVGTAAAALEDTVRDAAVAERSLAGDEREEMQAAAARFRARRDAALSG